MAEAEFPDDFTANASPALTDYVFVGKRKVLVSDLATLLATDGALAPPVEWNATDDTQLAADNALPAPGFDTGLTSASLSIATVATVPGGKSIRLTAAASAANKTGIFWFDDPIDGSFECEFYVQMNTPTVGDEWYAGVAFLGDATVGTAFTYGAGFDAAGSPAISIGRGDAPSGISVLAAAGGLSVYGAFVRIRVIASKTPGIAPGIFVQHEIMDFAGARVAGGFSTGSLAAFSSAWNASACNRVGVMLASGGNASNGVTANIVGLTFRRLAGDA